MAQLVHEVLLVHLQQLGQQQGWELAPSHDLIDIRRLHRGAEFDITCTVVARLAPRQLELHRCGNLLRRHELQPDYPRLPTPHRCLKAYWSYEASQSFGCPPSWGADYGDPRLLQQLGERLGEYLCYDSEWVCA